MWRKCQICKQEILPSQQHYTWLNQKIIHGYAVHDWEYYHKDCFDNAQWSLEMPKATLSYEALQLDAEGIPTEGAYKLKLEGNFKTHIEPIVTFIKASIPSSDRTYDPNSREWAFHERFWPLMEQAFKGSHFQVSFTVRKEDFVELKRKQAEFAKQAGQTFQTRQVPIETDLEKFQELLINAYSNTQIKTVLPIYEIVKNWTKEQALKAYRTAIRFYHPDLHPERAAQASELNEVWSRLKESYYIK